MSILTTVDHGQEGETRFHIVMSEDENVRELVVIVTPEGILMDVYDKVEEEEEGIVLDDVHSGTAGMMFDEWADWVVDADRAEILTTVASHATWENEKPVFP